MADANLNPYECGCGWLERAAADPSVPIAFDAEVNEYYVQAKAGDLEGHLIIKFCPSCGGDAPVSTRRDLFSVVSVEDRARIHELANKFRTKSELIAAWGQPDEEVPNGYGMSEPDKEGRESPTVLFDVLRYNNLLPTAIVEAIVRPDDRINLTYSPRPRKGA
jgi:hypothetical protein